MGSALRFGEMAMIHYKSQVNRPRPSQLCYGLLTPFGYPRHSAWPSGHSLQGHLLTQLLLQVDGIVDRFGNAADPDNELLWLAERCAESRERAGFHYHTDTIAGRELAAKIAQGIASGAIDCPYYTNTVLKSAKAEWT
jgi:hypothetical protein